MCISQVSEAAKFEDELIELRGKLQMTELHVQQVSCSVPWILVHHHRRRFWHRAQDYVALYHDHILHGAISIALGSVRLWHLRSAM